MSPSALHLLLLAFLAGPPFMGGGLIAYDAAGSSNAMTAGPYLAGVALFGSAALYALASSIAYFFLGTTIARTLIIHGTGLALQAVALLVLWFKLVS